MCVLPRFKHIYTPKYIIILYSVCAPCQSFLTLPRTLLKLRIQIFPCPFWLLLFFLESTFQPCISSSLPPYEMHPCRAQLCDRPLLLSSERSLLLSYFRRLWNTGQVYSPWCDIQNVPTQMSLTKLNMHFSLVSSKSFTLSFLGNTVTLSDFGKHISLVVMASFASHQMSNNKIH